MPSGNRVLLLGALLAIVFLYGTARLFLERFEAGDAFPSYSSLRSDPLGCRIFHDSLRNMQEYTVARNLKPIATMDLSQPATLFFIGVSPFAESEFTSEKTAQKITAFIKDGGRVVVTFFPVTKTRPYWAKKPPAKAVESEPADNDQAEEPDKEADGVSAEQKDDREKEDNDCAEDKDDQKQKVDTWLSSWGMTIAAPQEKDAAGRAAGAEQADGRLHGKPFSLPWHGQRYFTELDKNWRQVLAVDGRPVMIERPMGFGSIVLATDSYFLSNEAMWRSRQTALLTWLLGDHRRVVIDEALHGISQRPTIMGLARQYDLHGFFLALLLLAGLFLWRMSPLLAPYPASTTGIKKIGAEKDHFAGLINIIRRNVPTATLLAACFREWQKTAAAVRAVPKETREKIAAVANDASETSGAKADPVSRYKKICRLLARKSLYAPKNE